VDQRKYETLLITMARYRTPSMSVKQAEFIKNLVDQLGFKDSPHKDYFLERIGFEEADIEYASFLIESLLEENKRRKFFNHKKINEDETPSVQDLAQFVFCPASYAIKRSFVVETNQDHEIVDYNEPPKSYLLERITTLKTPLDKIEIESQEYFKNCYQRQIEDFKVFMESRLVYNGYSDIGSESKHSKEANINGRPHLIFQENNGQRTIVVEKTTYKNAIPDILWKNNKIQALAYLYLFEEFKCSQAVVIYWRRTIDGEFELDREYKLFNIFKSDSIKESLISELRLFNNLTQTKKIPFNTESINPAKCFKCSCRTLCNHKSGLINDLLFPYITPEYSKKYPLYYTWKEQMELIKFEHKEIMDEINNDIINELPDEVRQQLKTRKNKDK